MRKSVARGCIVLTLEGFTEFDHVIDSGAEYAKNEKNQEDKDSSNNILHPMSIRCHELHPEFILHSLHFRVVNYDAVTVAHKVI